MNPQPASRAARQAFACAIMLLVALCPAAMTAGCKASDPKLSEAFAGQREAMLARSLRTAAKMHERASTTADESLANADRAVQARRTDFDAYEEARRSVLSTEGRVRDAGQHAERVEFLGSELFDQWRRDLRQYTSDELRDQASARLDRTRDRTDAVLDELRLARESIEPVRRRLIDAALWLKHHRHEASPPDPTRTAEDQALLDSQVAAMRQSAATAVRSATELANELSPEDPGSEETP